MKAILFDIDDTLYDMTQPFVRAYQDLFAEKYEYPAEAVFKSSRKYSDEVYAKSMSGEISMQEMYIYRIRRAMEDFGTTVSEQEALRFQEVYETYQHEITMSDTMKDLLEFCSRKVQTGIITNGPSAHQWDKVQALGVLQWIDREHVFVSVDVGIPKPERGIFDFACEKMNLRQEEVWYIGDSYENDVLGAKGAGLCAVWMNRRKHPVPADSQADACVTTEEELRMLIEGALKAQR
jgi:putative hydrolase of the HAD superfamily